DIESNGNFNVSFQAQDVLVYNVIFSGTSENNWTYGHKSFRLLDSKSTYDIGVLSASLEEG
ncbi:MAG: hypothetical protein DSZ03_07825, partial [Sulfurimonas sp.]